MAEHAVAWTDGKPIRDPARSRALKSPPAAKVTTCGPGDTVRLTGPADSTLHIAVQYGPGYGLSDDRDQPWNGETVFAEGAERVIGWMVTPADGTGGRCGEVRWPLG